MPHDLMYECEKKTPWMVEGKKVWRWKVRDVKGLPNGKGEGIRCLHCHGAMRVKVQKVPGGPADHGEHIRKEDSRRCRGGSYFEGTHAESEFPVV